MKIKFDGKEIEVSALNLNQLVEVEDKFGSLTSLNSTAVPLKMVRFLAYQVIHPVYPELTEAQVGEKLDMASIGEIIKVLNPPANVASERPFVQP